MGWGKGPWKQTLALLYMTLCRVRVHVPLMAVLLTLRHLLVGRKTQFSG